MRVSNTFCAVALLPCALIPGVVGTRSTKRGLIYIPNTATPQDNSVWTQSGSDLTWYYNYAASPSSDLSSSGLQFVPMLFSAPTSSSDTSFSDTVKGLISGGQNISYVLTFNEPDGTSSTGGSNVPATLAASTWIREVEPLKKLGIQVGAPAVTGGSGGFLWLTDFFSACKGGCNPDFIPIHWYGNFEGLASHMGEVRGDYPNMTQWITEYALQDANLADTQTFYNSSADYFDRIDYVTHYSYFGSFRSSKSNVGPNVAMLDQNGHLTDIGGWYLGGGATGNIPQGGTSGTSGTSGPSGPSSDASIFTIGGAWALLVVGVCFCVL